MATTNLFNKKDAAKFFSIIFGVVAIIITIIAFLIKYPKPTAVWLGSAAIFFLVRRTDSWKMGVEIFYLLTFLLAYAFNLYYVLPMIYIVLILVIKVRPDEVNGAVIHSFILTCLALTSRFLFGIYGPGITESQFIFVAILSIFGWLIIDFFIALKISPVHWIKLIVNKTLNMIVNYFTITLIGYKLLMYFFTLA